MTWNFLDNGLFQVQDGLLLNGSSTLDAVGPWSTGCWRQPSSCGSQGMTIAFWVKLITGIENHGDTVGLISAQEEVTKEGWEIILYNWNGINKFMKFQVKDFQVPGKRFQKEIDTVTSLYGQWLHYVAIYQHVNPDNAGDQYMIYKNGQINNNGWADTQNNGFTANMVERLALGRQFSTQSSPPYANIMLDEVVFFDAALNAVLVDELYQHYIQH